MTLPPVTIYADGSRRRILDVLGTVERQLPQGSMVWVDRGLTGAEVSGGEEERWQGHASVDVGGAENRAEAIAHVAATVAAVDDEDPPVITGGDIFR